MELRSLHSRASSAALARQCIRMTALLLSGVLCGGLLLQPVVNWSVPSAGGAGSLPAHQISTRTTSLIIRLPGQRRTCIIAMSSVERQKQQKQRQSSRTGTASPPSIPRSGPVSAVILATEQRAILDADGRAWFVDWSRLLAAILVGTVTTTALPVCYIVVTRRRASRIGKCQMCSYSMIGLPAGAPCPECGAARGGGTHPSS
jgi:hypothetical protein